MDEPETAGGAVRADLEACNPWPVRMELLLDRYRRADGERWKPAEIERETEKRGRGVSQSYLSALRRGRIRRPGGEHLAAIAGAMGFPMERWFAEDVEDRRTKVAGRGEGDGS